MKQIRIQGLEQTAPISFGVRTLEDAWKGTGCSVDVRVNFSSTDAAGAPISTQGYERTIEGNVITSRAGGEAGAMYALLDLAHFFRMGADLSQLKANRVEPHVKKRGIKFNIPLDARTPSYSDNGDSAQENIAHVWDFAFWTQFLDRMAFAKYNVLSLWNMSPGPSMVKVEKYPDVALDDVMRATHAPNSDLRGMALYTPVQEKSLVRVRKMSIDEKIIFWRNVMDYAAQRCIRVYLFIWNIYTYGTEHTSYGITDDADNPVTRDYVRRTTEALILTYPRLAGIGVTAGENMRKEWKVDVREDIEWVRATYGRGIEDALSREKRESFVLIHRSHMAKIEQMEEVFSDFDHTLDYSYKYSMAHMYASDKPRFGDSFFSSLPAGRKTWLTVRNDDFYLLQWGDPDFARSYLKKMPLPVMEGFYFGSDGMVWGRDYSHRSSDLAGEMYIDRHWYEWMIWGFLSYDINVADEVFIRSIAQKHKNHDAHSLFDAQRLASKAMTLPQRVAWNDYDFHWYPEASCSFLEAEQTLVFRSIVDFASSRACPGINHLSIAEYVEYAAANRQVPLEMTTPIQVADQMTEHCHAALNLLQPQIVSLSADDQDLIWNSRDMAHLGMYYADKIRAAVHLGLYKSGQKQENKDGAIEFASRAYEWWLLYSSSISKRFRPRKLGRLRNTISPDQFDEIAAFDIHIAKNL